MQFTSAILALVSKRKTGGLDKDGCAFESKIQFWCYLDRVLKWFIALTGSIMVEKNVKAY